jgi:hypothetical protein
MLAHLADRVTPNCVRRPAAASGFWTRKVSIDADEIRRFWSAWSMIRKSGNRFSEKIMLPKNALRGVPTGAILPVLLW